MPTVREHRATMVMRASDEDNDDDYVSRRGPGEQKSSPQSGSKLLDAVTRIWKWRRVRCRRRRRRQAGTGAAAIEACTIKGGAVVVHPGPAEPEARRRLL